MTESVQRLLTVRDQARQARDEAQRALQQAEQQCAQARSQGQMLQSYRSDTAVRWTTPRDRATDTVQMDTAHHFLARLDTALRQHEFNLHQVTTQATQRRAALLAAETRLAALNKLIERRQKLVLAQTERREQVASDQLAQRRSPADTPHPSASPQETQPCPH